MGVKSMKSTLRQKRVLKISSKAGDVAKKKKEEKSVQFHADEKRIL